MELFTLPDDCLRLILEQCSLQHLIHLKLVSCRFNNLIKQICTSKRQLKIFGSFYEIQQYNQSLIENYIDHLPGIKIDKNCSDVIIIHNSNSASIYKISQRYNNKLKTVNFSMIFIFYFFQF